MIVLKLSDDYKIAVFKPSGEFDFGGPSRSFEPDEILFAGRHSDVLNFLADSPDVDGLIIRIRRPGRLPLESPGEIRDGRLHVFELHKDDVYRA